MDDSSAFNRYLQGYTLHQKNGYYLTWDDLYLHNERYTSQSHDSSSSSGTTSSTSDGKSSDTAASLHYSNPSRIQYLQRLTQSPQLSIESRQHKVSRKPVASLGSVVAQPPLYQKQLQQHQQQQVKTKNYAAADTIHPKRMYKQSTSSPQTAAVAISSPFLSDHERKATRRSRHHSTIIPMRTNPLLLESPKLTSLQKAPAETVKENDNVDMILPSSGHEYRHSMLTSTPTTSFPCPTAAANDPLSISIVQESPTNFWNPRTTDIHHQSLEPIKKNIRKKIRGLLQPHRTLIETKALNEQYQRLYKESLQRCQTPPLSSYMENNPFDVLYCQEAYDHLHQLDFGPVDQYASTVQHKGLLITPSLLSQKFLARPYPNNDVYKLRAIFIWIVQHIRPEYHQKRHDLLLLRKQQQLLLQPQDDYLEQKPSSADTVDTTSRYKKKTKKLLQKLRIDSMSLDAHQDGSANAPRTAHNQTAKLDAMHLLEEEYLSFLPPMPYTADEVEFEEEEQKMVDHALINNKLCQTAFDMAHLFYTMASAAGLQEVRVIYGYLKGPTSTAKLSKERSLPINHAWCSVKIQGEYRFIDCWLASPFHPHNSNQVQTHWFLTKPSEMILTHCPRKPHEQCLQTHLTIPAFLLLPYIRTSFFEYSVRILNFQTGVSHNDTNDNQHRTQLSFIRLQLLQPDIRCYADIECDNGQNYVCCLTQCSVATGSQEGTICDIKAVLPAQHSRGWLKVYMAWMTDLMEIENIPLQKRHYSLAMCIPVYQQQQQQQQLDNESTITPQFAFVQLYHLSPKHINQEYYIQEPQCYYLYPLQTYHFSIKANLIITSTKSTRPLSYQQQHHKLAVKSPSGKLIKLMYYPQDQTYDGNVMIAEAGKWTLVCFISANHHDCSNGTSYIIAQWNVNTFEPNPILDEWPEYTVF